MSKVITFSRTFPAYHPRKGEPTYFVEKFWQSIGLPEKEFSFNLPDEYQHFMRGDNSEIWAKHQTIRAGNRWKVGDKFSPRVWSGKPYNSKQIIIAPDTEIKKVWNVEIWKEGSDCFIGIKIAEKWKVGDKIKNDGIILIIAVKERKIRIEVGYGSEEKINDAKAGRILDEEIIPFLKKNDWNNGITAGVLKIKSILK